MADQEAQGNAQRRKSVVEKMWLHYYNDQLLRQGTITTAQHRQMKTQINTRRPSAQR